MKRGALLAGLAAVAVATMGAKGCSSTSGSSPPGVTAAPAAGGTATATTTAPGPTVAPATAPPPTTAPPTTVPVRTVVGKAAVLGAGTFSVPTDVQPGLYNVTAAGSGNFVVTGTDSYDEILGTTSDSVPSVRVTLAAGDSVQISGLARVVFTPVTSPFVLAVGVVHLGAGTWTAGEDIAAGRYVATTTPGASGNFIVGGSEDTDEILGGSDGVPSVTVALATGDTITVSGLADVTMTPA